MSRMLDISCCQLCPNLCGVNRTSGELGLCRMDGRLKVAHYLPHHGEEPPLSGNNGAGTIFFTGCSLGCLWCQNYQASQQLFGEVLSIEELANRMLSLQHAGCHNIDLVSPAHYLPHILSALTIAKETGLSIPIVYNTSGYEREEALELLNGMVDIYLPDLKYADDKNAFWLSKAKSYVQTARRAIIMMHRQVGDLIIDSEGIAQRGLIIRMLVLPDDLAGCKQSLQWIAENIGTQVHISIMAQYNPLYLAKNNPQLNRRITDDEYMDIIDYAEHLGFENAWIQDPSSSEYYNPDFTADEPFEKG